MNSEENQIFKKVIVGFGIIIVILFVIVLSKEYEINVQKCINHGNSEHYCRTELSK